MAIRFMDSFDHYGGLIAEMAKGTYLEAGIGVVGGGLVTSRSRTGAYGFHFTNGTAIRRVIENRPQTAGAACSLWFDVLPAISNRAVLFAFNDRDNNQQVWLGVNTDGSISAWLGSEFVTPIATSSPVLTTGAWQHVEARVMVDATAGEVEVRVNGVTVIAASGVTTKNSGSGHEEVAQVRVYAGIGVTQVFFTIDDFFLWDTEGSANNDFIGDRRVMTDVADQDTVIADWQLSTGVNGFALINEVPPDDDTTYLFAEPDQVGDQSAFEFADLSAEVSAVTAIMITARTIKTDAGPATAQISVFSNSTEGLAEERAITTTWTDRQDIFETNPDTGAPWTRTEVNAALIAIKRTA